MASVFLTLFNMSLTASWLVLAVILFKLIFRKAPKFIHCALWALVALRLLIPISLESVFSLVPSSEVIPQDFIVSDHFDVHTGFAATNAVINDYLDDRYYEGVTVSNGFGRSLTEIVAAVWLAGLAALLIYAAVSYIRLRLKTREAVKLETGIYMCDGIPTPFILGLIRPKIFVPSSVDEADIGYVLAHEKAHLKRLDYLWKPLGYLILCVYWFNPVMWLAYILLCRDIEFACDEKVISTEGEEIKKAYSTALLNCSMPGRFISACPIAFGETGVRQRISAVLNYRKPAFWIVLAAVAVSMVIAVCFLTNPKTEPKTYRGDIYNNAYFTVSEIIGQPMAISMVITPESMPHYFVHNDVLFTTETRDTALLASSAWVRIGELEEFELTKENFDDLCHILISGVDFEKNDAEFAKIRNNNLIAKRVHQEDEDSGIYDDYYLLYQKNGDVLLCGLFTYLDTGLPGIGIISELELKCNYEMYDSDNIWTGTPDRDIGIVVKELDYDSENPHITITWVNDSDEEWMYGEGCQVYYIAPDGELESLNKNSVSANDLLGHIVKPHSTAEWTASLGDCRFNSDGWYRIYINMTSQGAKDGFSEYFVDFCINPVSFNWSKPCKRYIFNSSPDYTEPKLALYDDGSFEFLISAFQNRIIKGKYKTTGLKEKLLTLTDSESGNIYVFKGDEYGNYIFDASLSADVPSFRYSAQGASRSPVPDGAYFELKLLGTVY